MNRPGSVAADAQLTGDDAPSLAVAHTRDAILARPAPTAAELDALKLHLWPTLGAYGSGGRITWLGSRILSVVFAARWKIERGGNARDALDELLDALLVLDATRTCDDHQGCGR